MHFSKNPDYFVSQSFSYFGYVKQEMGDYLLIIGPIFSTPHSDFTLRNFMKEWASSLKYKAEIEHFLSISPVITFHQFLHTLAYLHMCLNDKSIDVERHFELDHTKYIYDISRQNAEQLFDAKENQNHHNTWHFERELMGYVEAGESKKVEELLRSTATLTEGTLADNALRQRKNILITTIALVMRSAISGGLDIEQAYHLADVYILECERSQDISYVATLEYSMIMDFTDRVAKTKIPKGMSQEIFDCIQFINRHINEPIQVSDVADHIGKSSAYLSAKFKKELGFQISSFIMRCRLEEAKSLLTYSDKSLNEISTYLCFSSQSYFQNVFKKKYGMTPKQYRAETQQV